jgi:hypothetical protein
MSIAIIFSLKTHNNGTSQKKALSQLPQTHRLEINLAATQDILTFIKEHGQH